MWNFSLLSLLCLVGASTQNFQGTKRTYHKDENGMKAVVETSSTNAKCYQYTWLGPENRKTNSTETCIDLEVDSSNSDGPPVERPCFSPLVWTTDDENGKNRPRPEDIVEACKQVNPPCNPTCTPTGGQSCIKYTLIADNKEEDIVRETSFCGRVFLDGDTLDKETCKTQKGSDGFDVILCSCSEKSYCNAASQKTIYFGLVLALATLILTL